MKTIQKQFKNNSKTIQKQFNYFKSAVTLMLIFFVIYSCDKEELETSGNDFTKIQFENGVKNKPTFLFEIKKIPTAELLANSENFQNLNKMLMNHIKQGNDYNRIKRLSSKSTIATSEEQQILLRMGYESEQEFLNIFSEIQHFNNLLAQEFDFNNFTEGEKSGMFIAAFETISIEEDYWDDSAGGGDSCSQIYSYCMTEALSDYKMDIFMCAAAGATIGTIATPWLGLGATVFCVDWARDKYEARKGTCSVNLSTCIK